MKKLDSLRLLDLLLMVLCTGLSIIFTFMISLGYNQVSNYFVEIVEFPYFIAFLPAMVATFIHACINLVASKKFGRNLIDLAGCSAKRHADNAFYIACGGLVIGIVFVVLFLTKALPGEEYLYVLVSLPMGLAPYAYLLFIEIYNIANGRMPKSKKIARFCAIFFIGIVPIALGLATYLPGVLGWSYLGIAMFPLAYIVGDSVSFTKGFDDISEGDEF